MAIKDKLQKTDIDQEVKQCSIIAIASFLTVCHKNLNQQQINGIIAVYNDRLQNELTRDAALKAITKICLNQNARDQALISLTNLNTRLPKVFDLLHKAQRSLQLNALEALEAMLLRYPQQFAGSAPPILKELEVFVTDADLQSTTLALKVATYCA
jgi:hypothetical protein